MNASRGHRRRRIDARRMAIAVQGLMAAVLATVLNPVAGSAAAPYTFTQLKCSATRDGAYDIEVTASGLSGVQVGDDYLQLLDVSQNPARVVGTTTGAFGEKVSVHPNRVNAYVASNSADAVFVLDISGAPRVVGRITVPSVRDVEVSADGRYLYVVNSSSGAAPYLRTYSLAVPRTPKRVGVSLSLTYSASAVAIAPNGKSAAITMYDKVAIVRLADPIVPVLISRVGVPFDVRPVAYSRDSTTIFAGGSIRPSYATVSVGSRRLTSTRTIGQVSDSVSDLEVSSDNKLLWLTTSSAADKNSIYAFGIASGSAHLLVSGIDYPSAVGVSRGGPTRGRVYFPSLINGDLCGIKQSPA